MDACGCDPGLCLAAAGRTLQHDGLLSQPRRRMSCVVRAAAGSPPSFTRPTGVLRGVPRGARITDWGGPIMRTVLAVSVVVFMGVSGVRSEDAGRVADSSPELRWDLFKPDQIPWQDGPASLL